MSDQTPPEGVSQFAFHFEAPPPPPGMDIMAAAQYKVEATRAFDAFSTLVSNFAQTDYQAQDGTKAYDLANWLHDRVNDGSLLLGVKDMPENENGISYGIYDISSNAQDHLNRIIAVVLPKKFADISGQLMPRQAAGMIETLRRWYDQHGSKLQNIKNVIFSKVDQWKNIQTGVLKSIFKVGPVSEADERTDLPFNFDPDTGAPVEVLTDARIQELLERHKTQAVQSGYEPDSAVRPGFKIITTKHLDRLRREYRGWVKSVPWLTILDEARGATEKMTEGKGGVVIGSGEKTRYWKSKGWQTVDIDPRFQADFTADANNFRTVIPNQNFIFAERLDVGTNRGVDIDRFISDSYSHLNSGGMLIIDTVSQPGNPAIPDIYAMGKKLKGIGFKIAAELASDIYSPSNPQLSTQQRVIYYARKT